MPPTERGLSGCCNAQNVGLVGKTRFKVRLHRLLICSALGGGWLATITPINQGDTYRITMAMRLFATSVCSASCGLGVNGRFPMWPQPGME